MKKIIFKDLPSTETPIDATNLNAIQDNAEEAINNVETLVGNLIESGSNENGSWIKYSDGTMICYGTVEIAKSTNNSIINFPQTFYNNNYGISYCSYFANKKTISASFDQSLNGSVRIWPYDTNSGAISSVDTRFSITVIGRWK